MRFNLRLKKATPKEVKDLKILDSYYFYGCENEFKPKRTWWLIKKDDIIIAYCGAIFTDSICIFNRAWVDPDYRGLGIQQKMIEARVKEAKSKRCYRAITYTTPTNIYSANNLIAKDFKLYHPCYSWGGKHQLYFFKDLLPL